MSLSVVNNLAQTAQFRHLESKEQNHFHSERTVRALNDNVTSVVNEYRNQAYAISRATCAIAIATLFSNFLDYHFPTNTELSGSLKTLKTLASVIPHAATGAKEVHQQYSQGNIFQLQHKIEKMKSRLSQLQQEASRSPIQEYIETLTDIQRRLRYQYN